MVWEVEHRNYLLFQKLGVTVRGTAIKFTDGQTVRATRRVAPERSRSVKPPVQRNHSITLARSALSGGFTYHTYDRRTRRHVRRELDYGSGWSIAYKPRLPDKRWYITPSVSVTNLDELTSIAVMGNAVLALDQYTPIPLDGLAPYVEAGAGYTPIVWHDSENNVVEWALFGWSAGIGATLPIRPGLALDVSANRQASIRRFGTWWSPDRGFYRYAYQSEFTSDPHFWRFGVGLVLRR